MVVKKKKKIIRLRCAAGLEGRTPGNGRRTPTRRHTLAHRFHEHSLQHEKTFTEKRNSGQDERLTHGRKECGRETHLGCKR